MKVLKIILTIVVIIFAGYCIWMLTLPKDYTLERATVIDAPPSMVFDEVNNLKSWDQWSPWSKMDSLQTMEFSDPALGQGAYYTWEGEITKSGKYTNSEVVENESIKYDMEFEGMGSSDGYWKFEPTGEDQTKVTWGYHMEFGFFDRMGKYFIDGMLGKQFEQGLEDLKDFVESKPQTPEVEITVENYSPLAYYAITDEVSFRDMGSDFFAERYEELGQYLGEDMQNMNGAPFAIYQKWDEENEMAVVSVALPVTSEKPATDRIEKGMTHEGKVAKAVYMGPYEGTGEAHVAIDKYMQENNLQMAGSPWEVYVTDPGNEPDASKWITEIYYPLASE